jgi:UDP-glucose 4-epimerase
MSQHVLVTGGAGYIGSHACVELLSSGHRVVVVDNLVNSSAEALRRVQEISGKSLIFVQADLLDRGAVERLFDAHAIDAVMHFAGLKAVGESTQKPLLYYHNNLTGTLHLLESMQRRGIKRFVFSSSATVYGDPERIPIPEDAALRPTNPYGRTKLFIEEFLRDLAAADPDWRIAALRYFNPVGAHPSGRIGEDPVGIPNNLMPFLMQVAVGKRDSLRVYGSDYPTPDGTGVRDYIHVIDLVRGHIAAIDQLDHLKGFNPINLGTGRGYSVLVMIKAVEKASGRKVPYQIVDRRPGDVATSYADASRAKRDLGWSATMTLEQMCADSWRWQSGNPEGYKGEKREAGS